MQTWQLVMRAVWPPIAVLLVLLFLIRGVCAVEYQPTVTCPFPDLIKLEVPDIVKDSDLAQMGLLDVTGFPFNADPTGKADVTIALQKAIKFARDNQLVCYFPSGRYLVSDTIECYQLPYKHSRRGIAGAKFFPVAMVGARSGTRPEITLAPNSKGFNDPDNPKYVIDFQAMDRSKPKAFDPTRSFNQVFINIDITIDKGNSGAVGIRHRGAQGSAIEECTVNATYGYIGIEGGLGSGGSIVDVTVIGGCYGLFMEGTQPAPTITGITLKNQTRHAILYGGRQSLSAVGVHILTATTGPAIRSVPKWLSPHYGEISLVDSTVEFAGPPGIAVSTKRALYMRNVYVKGAKILADISAGENVRGCASGWVHVTEMAYTGQPPEKWKSLQFRPVIYVDGERKESILSIKRGEEPPEDQQSRNLWKHDYDVNYRKAVNVKRPPYSAKGDGKADDTAALQKAINENEFVFLPKGLYKITRTLDLQKDTKLFGVAKHLSIIVAVAGEGFGTGGKVRPAICTAKGGGSENYLSFFGILMPVWLGNASALNWAASGDSVMRDVNFYNENFPRGKDICDVSNTIVPNVVVSDGGGKWYNFFQIRFRREGGYRHLLVKKTQGPLRIYQCDLEHVSGEPAGEFRNAAHISVYGLKGESLGPYATNAPIIQIKNCRDIGIYGYGGNAGAPRGGCLFQIIDSNRVTLVNLVDTPILSNSRPNIREWSMVIEKRGHRMLEIPALERPVLYKRGEGDKK